MNQSEKNPVVVLLQLIAGLGVVFAIYVFIIVFSAEVAPEINDLYLANGLQNNIAMKNLSVPLPSASIYSDSGIDIKEIYLNKSLSEFHNLVVHEYFYEDDTYDCKYWSYVWTLWWAENLDKHNLELDYITTDNHIFVMFSNESGYCTADENILDCRGIQI